MSRTGAITASRNRRQSLQRGPDSRPRAGGGRQMGGEATGRRKSRRCPKSHRVLETLPKVERPEWGPTARIPCSIPPTLEFLWCALWVRVSNWVWWPTLLHHRRLQRTAKRPLSQRKPSLLDWVIFRRLEMSSQHPMQFWRQ